jgi:hypothetical protein
MKTQVSNSELCNQDGMGVELRFQHERIVGIDERIR